MLLENQDKFNELINKYKDLYPILFKDSEKKIINYLLKYYTVWIGYLDPNTNQHIIYDDQAFSQAQRPSWDLFYDHKKNKVNKRKETLKLTKNIKVFLYTLNIANATRFFEENIVAYLILTIQFPQFKKCGIREILDKKEYKTLIKKDRHSMILINKGIDNLFKNEKVLLNTLNKFYIKNEEFIILENEMDYLFAGMTLNNCLGTHIKYKKHSLLKHKVYLNKNIGIIAYSYHDFYIFDYIKANLGYKNKKFNNVETQIPIISKLNILTRLNYIKSITITTMVNLIILPLCFTTIISLFFKFSVFFIFISLLLSNLWFKKDDLQYCLLFIKSLIRSLSK